MFWRMMRGRFVHAGKKLLLIALTIALGASLFTAMINVLLGVGDKVNAELKTYGANITIIPREASLLDELYGFSDTRTHEASFPEEELRHIKEIFWGHNITAYAPYYSSWVTVNEDSKPYRLQGSWFSHSMKLNSGELFTTGLKSMKQWWKIEGNAPEEGCQEAMLGCEAASELGLAPGDTIRLKGEASTADLRVSGILSSGSEDDRAIFTNLETAQDLEGERGRITKVEVSALTTPDNDLARKAARNPKSLSLKEWEAWYCTAYVSAVTYQLEDAMAGVAAKPVRQVAESEGAILDKVQSLMTMIALLSMAGSAFGISNLVTTSVMERSSEIGLMKAIGAHNRSVVHVVLAEIMLTGLLGGLVGYPVGLIFTQLIGRTVFASNIDFAPMAIPLVFVMVLLVSVLGSVPAIRLLTSLRPSDVLHGR